MIKLTSSLDRSTLYLNENMISIIQPYGDGALVKCDCQWFEVIESHDLVEDKIKGEKEK